MYVCVSTNGCGSILEIATAVLFGNWYTTSPILILPTTLSNWYLSFVNWGANDANSNKLT